MPIDLKKTLNNLRELEHSSKKYKGDLTKRAVFRHILKLLARISKMPIRKEEPEQEAGEQRFRCAYCEGDGFRSEWNSKGTKLIIEDCIMCKGEGFIIKEVVDKRKVSKNKKLEYKDEF